MLDYSRAVEIIRTVSECRSACQALARLALVPTMGALHPGHLSLIERARQLADHVAVSVFVNPTQFGPSEDFSRYPRPFERDLELCRSAGVDLVFAPGVEEMYPPGVPRVTVEVPALASLLDGRHRPGHFAGVCGVVAKLFNIVGPQLACFGEKDFQQLAVIRAMVRGLDMPVTVIGCPTLRDPDGMAMSSRNQFLTPDDRVRGLSISRALRAAANAVADGVRDAAQLRAMMRSILEDDSGAKDVKVELQYAAVVDPGTLLELDQIDAEARALIAMKVGSTRLIDNAALIPPLTERH